MNDNDDDDTKEVRIVSDYMIRSKLTVTCGRATRSRKRFCILVGGVNNVIATVDEVASLAPDNPTYSGPDQWILLKRTIKESVNLKKSHKTLFF